MFKTKFLETISKVFNQKVETTVAYETVKSAAINTSVTKKEESIKKEESYLEKQYRNIEYYKNQIIIYSSSGQTGEHIDSIIKSAIDEINIIREKIENMRRDSYYARMFREYENSKEDTDEETVLNPTGFSVETKEEFLDRLQSDLEVRERQLVEFKSYEPQGRYESLIGLCLQKIESIRQKIEIANTKGHHPGMFREWDISEGGVPKGYISYRYNGQESGSETSNFDQPHVELYRHEIDFIESLDDFNEVLDTMEKEKEAKRIQSEAKKRDEAISFARTLRGLGEDSSKIKFYDDEAGLSKLERQTLDRDTGYKRDENDHFW